MKVIYKSASKVLRIIAIVLALLFVVSFCVLFSGAIISIEQEQQRLDELQAAEQAQLQREEDARQLALSWLENIEYIHLSTVEEVTAEQESLLAYQDRLTSNLEESFDPDTREYVIASEIVSEETANITDLLDTYEQRIVEIYQEEEDALWEAREKQYPVATKVWLYMKENFGWTDVVCAGVMGNIMGEIGGGVLGFTNWDHDAATYGMFQWLGGRKKDLKRIYGNKPTIEEQLEFMYDELYGTDGVRKQVTNKQRDKILNGKTPEEVAMAFCRYFERPGGTGLARKGYARKAYNYFTTDIVSS